MSDAISTNNNILRASSSSLSAGKKSAFPPLRNDLILRAARNETIPRAPVWIMRQAGRYLPEFQRVREENDFFQICRNPELASEITLQPIRRFPGLLDAAIIFSDILVIPQALGMTVKMEPGIGPVFPLPLQNANDLSHLQPCEASEKLKPVYEAISLTRHKLEGQVPLVGFTGGPWTLMCYMIEGGGSKTLSKAKKWLYTDPESSRTLLQILTDVSVEHLVGQVKAGAQMLQVFESNADQLGPKMFNRFCLPYLKQICDRVHSQLTEASEDVVPMTVFAKGGGYHAIRELGTNTRYDVISLDWTILPEEARKVVGEFKVLQGNLDPCALYSSTEDIYNQVRQMTLAFGFGKEAAGSSGKPQRGWIANLGHGIYPDVDVQKAENFLKAIHEYSSNQ